MSNTPAEVMDHKPFIDRAFGNVMVAGLGLGMVIQALIDKEEVKSITVIEIDQTIIELCGSYYKGLSPKLRIICADILSYYEPTKYDAMWFDIWDAICADNIEQMKFLKERWRKNSKVRMCWAEEECRQQKKEIL